MFTQPYLNTQERGVGLGEFSKVMQTRDVQYSNVSPIYYVCFPKFYENTVQEAN